jgi:hypothetical protein
VEPEGSLSASERGLVGCLVLYSGDILMGVWGVERGLERTQFARLLSRPLLWLTGLSHIELMSPAMREA